MSAERILLFRHARTSYNQQSRFQGHLDIALDEVGEEQAARAARLLAGQLKEFGSGPIRLVSSDLTRALSTASALGELIGVAPEPDPRLREVFAGEWQGLTVEEITARWAGDYAAWRRGDDVRVGGGETRSEVGARAAECLAAAAESMDGGTLVGVSHGGTLRGAMFVLLGWPQNAWNVFEGLRNAHWAQLTRARSGDWRLTAYNLGGALEEYEPSAETG